MMNEEVEVSGSTTASETAESSIEGSSDAPISTSYATSEIKSSDSEDVQLEPTKSEMERERLMSKAEQLQEDIIRLSTELVAKEEELAAVKKELGITPFTEFRQSVSEGFKVVGTKWKEVQDTETFRKIDNTLSGWKQKVEGSDTYQKTVSTLNVGGKKVSGGLSSAGTKIKENETLKSVGEKTSSALRRTGTVIVDTGSSVGSKISGAASSLKERVWTSTDQADGAIPGDGNNPTKGETVVPDEPSKE